MEFPDEYDSDPILILISDPRVLGVCLELGPYVSYVWYQYGGIEYREWMENTDFTIVNEENE